MKNRKAEVYKSLGAEARQKKEKRYRFSFLFMDFSLLSLNKAKHKTTRYAGGQQIVIQKYSLSVL
ncbi:hypothetical protein [Schinkia azotoformans]|uniref:hypothetical protein n=1 Tax=Schinkia azotoformans TaxID=1454 RepID=UPI002DBA5729|nr:hypothetical protein [Schinkia azotoformans]MEC1789212.1 hypothetical protein [Schinkia azotoformans]